MNRLNVLASFFSIAIAMSPLQVFAWGGIVSGKIGRLDVTNAGNLPVRLVLEGSPTLCTGGMDEGYLDDADLNYKVYVSALLMAKAMNTTVTIYSDVGAYSKCKIGYISVL